MPDPSLDSLRADAEALATALARIAWRLHAGRADVRATADALAAAYAAHPRPLDADAWAMTAPLLDARDARDDAEDATWRLAAWVAETQGARGTAPLALRELAWEADAVVRATDGRAVPWGAVAGALAELREPAARRALDAARAARGGAELAPLRRDRLARERDALAALELAPDPAATLGRLADVDLAALAATAERLLRDTDAVWREALDAHARRRLDLPPDALTRGDVPALLRARELDAWLPAGGVQATVRTQVAAMGLDPDARGRIRAEVTAAGSAGRGRPVCVALRVPHEIVLVLRTAGGIGDWRGYLHELGHALHLAHVDADRPFEARAAGDPAVGEAFAFLFEQRVADGGWLARYLGLDRERAGVVRRAAAFETCYLVRRHAARFLHERALWQGDAGWDALADLYVDRLGAATGIAHHSEDAVLDVEERLHGMHYLRGWLAAAHLAPALRERFDADWWRNPRTGPWLAREAFAPGAGEGVEALVRRLDGLTDRGGGATGASVDAETGAPSVTAPLAVEPLVRDLEEAFA